MSTLAALPARRARRSRPAVHPPPPAVRAQRSFLPFETFSPAQMGAGEGVRPGVSTEGLPTMHGPQGATPMLRAREAHQRSPQPSRMHTITGPSGLGIGPALSVKSIAKLLTAAEGLQGKKLQHNRVAPVCVWRQCVDSGIDLAALCASNCSAGSRCLESDHVTGRQGSIKLAQPTVGPATPPPAPTAPAR